MRRKKEREIAGKPEPARIKVCPVCGKEFQVPVTNPDKECCSRDCADKKRTKKREKICPVCGKVFNLKYANSKQTCCSISCANKLRHSKK